MIRVLLADDHSIVREGLRRLADATSDIRVVAEVERGDDVIAAAAAEDVDVVVLDLSLPGMAGREILRRLTSAGPRPRVVVFSMHPEDALGVRLLEEGAGAYLCKTRPPRELLHAIRVVAAGRRHVTPELGERLLEARTSPADPLSALTPREREILVALAEGATPGSIAATRDLAPSTVSTHLQRIRAKLGLQSVAELVRFAIDHELVARRAR